MDKFYIGSKSMDRIRLPLVKPYEAINPDDTKWTINLPFNADAKASLLDMSIANIQSLAIQDSVIIAYAENTNCGGQPAPSSQRSYQQPPQSSAISLLLCFFDLFLSLFPFTPVPSVFEFWRGVFRGWFFPVNRL